MMCYFKGQRAKILQISKRKPLQGWKALRKDGSGWRSPIMHWGYQGSDFKVGRWTHASPHGYYVMTTRQGALDAVYPSPEKSRRVLIAGKVRQYAHGYRAEWMKVL
jgi:hypothetical protein